MSFLLLALCAVLAAAPPDSVVRPPAEIPVDSLVGTPGARFVETPTDSLVRRAAGRPAGLAADSLVRHAVQAAAPADTIVQRALHAAAPADTVVQRALHAAAPADTVVRQAAGSLAGLPGVGVIVEPFAPQVSATLTPSSVKARVESSLRAAAVRVLTERELAADRRMPVLDVSVVFTRPLGPAPQVAYQARLDLMQLVLLGAEPGQAGAGRTPFSAGTWSAGRLGAAYTKVLRDSVLINVDALAAAFAHEWRKQNRK
jgi:hypothetical protein